MQKRLFLWIQLYFFLLPISFLFAQVYTIDYLTYNDFRYLHFLPDGRWEITSYIFHGLDEYEGNGDTEEDEVNYYELRVFVLYRIYNKSTIKINSAIQTSALIGKYVARGGFGMPWIWMDFKLPFSCWFRVAYEFGKFGYTIWDHDNKFDVGLSMAKRFHFITIESLVSYRIHSRMTTSNVNPGPTQGYFDQYGNEIHYRFEPIIPVMPNTQLSAVLLGYYGNNKKYHGKILPHSPASKMALGANLTLHKEYKKIITFGLFFDLWGRYEKKGFTIVFNICH